MFFSTNLKLLRKRRGRSQEDLSSLLHIKRTSLSGYELGTSFPTYETLILISDFFQISIDKLLKVDLASISELQLTELEKGYDIDLTGNKMRVLATTVNSENDDNIEVVNVAAKAGYRAGYSDPDFIKVLPTFHLPFLNKNRKYRTFQISGDSMPPVSDGSFVTAEYLENWTLIKDGFPYIILTKDDGVVFKNVFNRIENEKSLLLCSTNPQYDPYSVDIAEVLELWKFVNYIDGTPPEQNLDKSQLQNAFFKLQEEVDRVKNMLK
ncbi:MAG: helix-turn-helix domain-containing protein [Vicingaceae bacterium]